MEMYNQMQYQNEQMMYYQAMQMQQQAYLYNSMLQAQSQYEPEDKSDKKSNKRSYVQCDLWKRQTLVERVEKDGMTIKDAAKQLEINYSTAKHIMKVYRQTGEVETKIMMKRKNKSSSSLLTSESNMETEASNQVKMVPQCQTYYYDMGLSQCQLPIDENMQDVNFQPEAFSNEERQSVNNFFFGSQCYSQ